ncbi:tRNA pseudouridine(38-40) synthase TruA [PVC group bacterium]|nr:tRNA pseudouridine(38-40) synthase TruA [PVC group bacterium]
MKPTRFKVTVSYDGTAYFGWQVQPNAVTVQENIESVLESLTGTKIKVHGSGRTDQGVHARAQVAHFDISDTKNISSLRIAMNALLPRDIRVMKAVKIDSAFHARKSAVGKEYRYFIINSQVMPPAKRFYATHIRNSLDIDAMRKAASILEGEHDFSAFTANPGRYVESHVRNLSKFRILKHGSEITIKAYANGFLFKMVRSLAGWLIKVGKGRASADETARILLSKTRTSRVDTAPSEGLFLWRVDY